MKVNASNNRGVNLDHKLQKCCKLVTLLNLNYELTNLFSPEGEDNSLDLATPNWLVTDDKLLRHQFWLLFELGIFWRQT